ncbi:OmpA family protein [Eisenibacter elegans]|uniref:OmpA family protein n=1 Tax=Eisenibacter elegans TaxID=997 RepID=UPI00040CDB59|nr:OmpA family protein [Eisenibacter elegans]
MKKITLLLLCMILGSSCVAKKKFLEADTRAKTLAAQLEQTQVECNNVRLELQGAQQTVRNQEGQIANLSNQVDFLKNTNTNLLERLSDLSVVSKAGAESIQRSLETLNQQSQYIKDLNQSMQRKDSLNLALVMSIKRSLDNINDEDIVVEVKKGVVYISISDKLLFRSGSAELSAASENVLSKIARVVNDHKDFDILVEGHTDNVPISRQCFEDNWDLSAKRAIAVVRHLQTKHRVAPQRMTAGGRSEYLPKASNATADGRSKNRRTEIIILPKLDEFFQLLENQPKN